MTIHKTFHLFIILLVISILFVVFSPLVVSKEVKNECIQDLEEYFIEKEMINYDNDNDHSMEYYYRLICTWNGYKYYCKYVQEVINSADSFLCIKDPMIQKYKDSNLIAEFDLNNIPNNTDKYECIVLKGLIHNNELFFTVRTQNSTALENNIYKIDLELSRCTVYCSDSLYGTISPTTLQFYNDQLLFITDKANVVLFDGKTEKLLCHVPLISEIMEANSCIEFDSFDLMGTNALPLYRCNYQVCYNGKEVYLIAGQNLFVYKNQKVKKLVFVKKLPNVFYYIVDESPICNAELIDSNSNQNLIKISIDWYSSHVFGKSSRYIYVYDVKMAKSKCFKSEELFW